MECGEKLRKSARVAFFVSHGKMVDKCSVQIVNKQNRGVIVG
jgi:hypothetical protein